MVNDTFNQNIIIILSGLPKFSSSMPQERFVRINYCYLCAPQESAPLSWHWQIIIYETHSHAHIINYYRWVQWSEWLLLSISSQFILPNATATSRFEWWGLKLISPTVDAMLSICIRPSNLFISTWTNPINYLQIAKNTYRHSHYLDRRVFANITCKWC